MKTLKSLLCMLLITIGLFGANVGANPTKEPTINRDVGMVEKVQTEQQNDVVMIQYVPASKFLSIEINYSKSQDLFAEQQIANYKLYPKVNDISKFWQHNKYGGGINLNDYLAKLT